MLLNSVNHLDLLLRGACLRVLFLFVFLGLLRLLFRFSSFSDSDGHIFILGDGHMLLLGNKLFAIHDGDVPCIHSVIMNKLLLAALDEDLTCLVVTWQPDVYDGTVLDFRHFRDRFILINLLLFLDGLGSLSYIILL